MNKRQRKTDKAYEQWEAAKIVYHVSAAANREAIKREGLRGKASGAFGSAPTCPIIFFVTDQRWAHNVARDIAADDFDLYAIDKGRITGTVVHDVCGEFYSPYSYYVEAAHIPPTAIIGVTRHRFDPNDVITLGARGLVRAGDDPWSARWIAYQQACQKDETLREVDMVQLNLYIVGQGTLDDLLNAVKGRAAEERGQ